MIQTFAQTLRAYRQAHNLTRRDAAHRHGISVRTWEHWENGRRPEPAIAALLLDKLKEPVALTKPVNPPTP